MSRGPDAGVLLERALLRHAADAGIELSIVSAGWTRWASATFAGARHDLLLSAVPSPALDDWIATLPEAEFTLRSHLVADLTVEARTRVGDRVELRIGVLTVEES
ncbi:MULTISPECIES: hypothetical protein [unclassified Sphingomonas]|uniref:hypothetical protein n=1 Tax=unclassified Sphingomonas TaxID=196159 RepID=UPI0021508C29|nr:MULTISPECIES: hypothetical protein [unclassified Sphingomonas]MCR5871650.1 hypothetical protein [Sphingomonas sp. J344]UUY00060.1 hypothetical protein LRS08_02675 [Sphingomonas sp. J315]